MYIQVVWALVYLFWLATDEASKSERMRTAFSTTETF